MIDEPLHDEAAAPEAVVTHPVKKDWGAWALKNKMYIFGGLVVIIMLACGGWVWLATQDAQASAPGIAGSTSSMNNVVSAPVVVDPAAPTDALDQKAAEEQSAKYGSVAPGPDEFLAQQNAASGSGLQDTAALASFRRAQRQEAQQKRAQQNQIRDEYVATAKERNTVTEMETRRDPSTGQYTQQPVKVHRSQAYSSDFVGAGANYGAARPKARPVRDRDGTPFETNDDVNEMLAGAGVGVQENYEKMTGRRYRPLDRPGTMDANAKAAMMYVPGLDGFNTVKYRGATADPTDELEQALVPDVFYRCLINGHQTVRTGSVVLLRLSEDATIGGVVFPRNMVFAAVASVESNHVALLIDRLGPHRVKAEVFNYNYMPGIMIDPEKRPKPEGGQSMASGMQQSGFQEMSAAIDRSASAANSPTGIAGRMGVAMINRIPPAGRKLREVLLPDGYPVLITTSLKAAGGSAPARTAAGGPTGQSGNPMQSPFMSGVGIGGYSGQPQQAGGN
jgi:hypothetical protein